jgi:hypothetical protein
MISASADVCNARLSFYIGYIIGSRLRNGRQLQHGRVLAYAQASEQHDLPVGELKGIMVRVRIVQVHLPETSHRVTDVLRFIFEEAQLKSGNLTLDIAFERDLGAGKQADGCVTVFGCAEAARASAKVAGGELVADLRRT